MTKKTLQEWYNDSDITDEQKEILNKLGVEDNSSEYFLGDLQKLVSWDEILERNKWKIMFSSKPIKAIFFFSTWWNNNLAIIVIESDRNHWLNLVIYEAPSFKKEEIFESKLVNNRFKSYEDWQVTKEKIQEIEKKLKSDNPILYNVAYNPFFLELYYYKDYPFPEVKSYDISLPCFDLEHVPDSYLKPLDIVKVYGIIDGKTMLHSAIYLGNGKVCHAFPDLGESSKMVILITIIAEKV